VPAYDFLRVREIAATKAATLTFDSFIRYD